MGKTIKLNAKEKRMIYYKHIRLYDDEGNLKAKGGRTIAIELDGDNYKVGIAECSKRDQYCKKTGREIAASRINSSLLPRQTIEDVLLAKAYYKPLSRKGYQDMVKSLPTEAIATAAIFEILTMLYRK